MKTMINEKRQMDFEYYLICDFIKLRFALGLTQNKKFKMYKSKVNPMQGKLII